jgi:outer membrane receptor protein involved in Fe transport
MKGTFSRQFGARYFSLALATLFLLAFAAVAAFGQAETGQIKGKVTDPNGAVVPNATVSVKSVATGGGRTATADSDGVYIVTNLQPGLYDVTFQGGSFAAATQRVEITTGARVTLDQTLGLQSVSGTVNVVAAGGVEVNTTSQELSNVVSATQLRELPTITRNPYALVAISGNVNEDAASGRGAGFSINGQRSASTNILLDGGQNVDNFTATIGMSVPLDAVGEFRVITSNFSAEYGRASGGIVNVSTRPGTSEFHGTGYEFYRSSALSSAGFDNNAKGTPKGLFTRNQFGYSIGGPIKKERLFFFNSTEWTRVRSSQTQTRWVMAPQLIAASNARTQAIFAGSTLAATPNGNIVTVATLCSPAGLNLDPMSTFCTTVPGATPALQQVTYLLPTDAGGGSPQNTWNTSTRIDWNYSSKTQIYGRYAISSENDFVGTVGASPYAGFNTGATAFDQNAIISATHTFTPNFVSQTKLVFNRFNVQQPLGTAPVQPTYYFRGTTASSFGGVRIDLPGYLPEAPGSAIPFGGPQNVGEVDEDLSWTHEKHTFRFGGQYVYMQDNRAFGAYEEAVVGIGTTNFTTAFNNFLNGNARSIQVAINPQGKTLPGSTVTLPVGPPDFTRSNRYNEWALYFNDSWRVRSRVTLNLGLRYEYYSVQHNKNRALDSNFNYGTGSTIFQQIQSGGICVDTACVGGGLWKPDRKDFAPRLGFAWDVKGNGKTAIRGGYGIAYERNFGNVTFNVIQNPPAYGVVTVTGLFPVPPPSNNFGPLGGSTGTATLPGTLNVRHVNENIKNAYAHFWSASFEHEMWPRTIVKAEYSGSAGRRLYDLTNDNRSGLACIVLGPTQCYTAANPNARLNLLYYPLNTRGNKGFSNYNGLIASIESSNLANLGLQFTARYTYSVSKDNLSSTFSESGNNFNLGLLDPQNPALDYGYSDFDARHRFVSGFTWNVPYFKNRHGALKQVLDGWELNGIVTVHSGNPFTIYDCSQAQFEVCPRLIPGVPITSFSVNHNAPSIGTNLFNLLDISNQAASAGAYVNPLSGNSEFGPFPANMTTKDAFRGPGYWNADFGLYKTFQISERVKLQIRGEFYNAFNHANMFLLGGNADISSFNNIQGQKLGNRNIQVAGKIIF